jgi:hypothetical protein
MSRPLFNRGRQLLWIGIAQLLYPRGRHCNALIARVARDGSPPAVHQAQDRDLLQQPLGGSSDQACGGVRRPARTMERDYMPYLRKITDGEGASSRAHQLLSKIGRSGHRRLAETSLRNPADQGCSIGHRTLRCFPTGSHPASWATDAAFRMSLSDLGHATRVIVSPVIVGMTGYMPSAGSYSFLSWRLVRSPSSPGPCSTATFRSGRERAPPVRWANGSS